MKYKYLVVNHTNWIYEEPDEMNGHWFQDKLDEYGVDDWELCAIDKIHVYFKRVFATLRKENES